MATLKQEFQDLVTEAKRNKESALREQVAVWLMDDVVPHCRERAREGKTDSGAIEIPKNLSSKLVIELLEDEGLTTAIRDDRYLLVSW